MGSKERVHEALSAWTFARGESLSNRRGYKKRAWRSCKTGQIRKKNYSKRAALEEKKTEETLFRGGKFNSFHAHTLRKESSGRRSYNRRAIPNSYL